MGIGIIALALIFFAGGVKNIKDSRAQTAGAGKKAEARRKLFFGVLMLVLGALITLYFIVSI